MELLIINDNPYDQNVYIYYDKATKEGVIIDASDSYETIRRAIEEHEITVKAILLTHGHFDHTLCVDKLRELTGAPVYAHEAEAELLKNSEYNRGIMRGLDISVVADKLFSDGEVFSLIKGVELQVIHTPGHTAGGVCYYDSARAVIFTGDTLFRETIGRTDMPTGDTKTLIASVRDKLFTLPDNVTVYPGHDQSTTISHEKEYNYRIGAN
ncbi:MAG: MBL fold metallo-hydrolase [Defluviitaleaceae bacterium]|nr:MBL fold metallo-hydrolase [Defluviitaleaceae bacterium]